MNPTFLLFLALIISREEPVNSKAPLSNEAPKCNAALQYYLAFLNSPSFERLPTEEQKLLENIETCSADNSLIPLLVSRYAPSLAYLRLGSRCPDCDWGINLRFRENPYGTVMPFGGSEIVQICRAACLRAKRSLSQGKFQEGLDDLMASLILARRLGQSGITFGKSLQAWLEKQAIQVSGSYLSTIPKTTILREFESKISSLPPTPSLSSLVLKEKEAYVSWIRKGDSKLIKAVLEDRLYKDDEDVKKFIRAMLGVDEARIPKVAEATSAVFDRAAKIVTLPPEECATEEKKLKEELAKVLETDLNKVLEGEDKAPIEKVFAVMLLPPLAKFRQVEMEAQARFALFQAAIAVLLRGEKELQKTKDPLGGAPFRLRKTDNGFDLVSQVKDKEGNPVRISIPKK